MAYFLSDACIPLDFLFQAFSDFMAAMKRAHDLPLFDRMFHDQLTARLPYDEPAILLEQSHQFAGFHKDKVI
jgi:hypothetical protein